MVCYQVYVDPNSFNVTLFGIFTSLRATRFPTPSREYSVYALLEGEPGERGDLRLRCTDETTGAVLADHAQRTEIGALGKLPIARTKVNCTSAGPPPNNSQFSEGEIWPVNDPPVVLTAMPRPDETPPDEGVLETVNDPVITLGSANS